MENFINKIISYNNCQRPFLGNSESGLSIIGRAEAAETIFLDGVTLCAGNHIPTLNSLIKLQSVVDELNLKDMLDYDNPDIFKLLLGFTQDFAECFFNKKIDLLESLDVSNKIVDTYPEIVNEAMYRIVDEKQTADIEFDPDDNDTGQFKDPFVKMAYQVAEWHSLKPTEVVNNWQTCELITYFAKIVNDKSHEAFLNWKYAQENAPKPPVPKEQKFFFIDKEVENG